MTRYKQAGWTLKTWRTRVSLLLHWKRRWVWRVGKIRHFCSKGGKDGKKKKKIEREWSCVSPELPCLVSFFKNFHYFFQLNYSCLLMSFIYLFIYLFMALLGLCCCTWTSSCCGARVLGAQASVVVARGLSSCGSQALERRLSSCSTRA